MEKKRWGRGSGIPELENRVTHYDFFIFYYYYYYYYYYFHLIRYLQSIKE